MHFLSFSPGVDLREILGKEAFHAVEIEDINALMECCNFASQEASGGRGACADALSWRNNEGITPLITATRKGNSALVQLLLEHGVDVNYNNNHNVFSAWATTVDEPYNNNHHVAPARTTEMFSFSPKNCGTALHEAAKRGNHSIAYMLLRHGAKPWAANRAGSTPFDFALSLGSSKMVELLKQFALHCATVKVKCNGFMGSIYKVCTCVVTPCWHSESMDPQNLFKRVYMFSGSKLRARVFLNYSKAQVIVDGRHRARLDMHGISSETVRCILPVEDAHVPTPPPYGGSVTAPCLVCGLLGYIGNLFFPIYLSYKLAKANDPERLELSHSGGRRDDPRGEQNRVIAAPPSHTSVFFMPPGEDLSSFQSFTSFLFSLVDEHCRPEYHPTHMVLRPPDQRRPTLSQPVMQVSGDSSAPYGTQNNQCQPTRALQASPSAAFSSTRDQEGVSHFDPQAAGYAGPILPRSSNNEEPCVICMSEPRQCGYLHGASLHACVCSKCAWALPPGKPCPLCRQTIEDILFV